MLWQVYSIRVAVVNRGQSETRCSSTSIASPGITRSYIKTVYASRISEDLTTRTLSPRDQGCGLALGGPLICAPTSWSSIRLAFRSAKGLNSPRWPCLSRRIPCVLRGTSDAKLNRPYWTMDQVDHVLRWIGAYWYVGWLIDWDFTL